VSPDLVLQVHRGVQGNEVDTSVARKIQDGLVVPEIHAPALLPPGGLQELQFGQPALAPAIERFLLRLAEHLHADRDPAGEPAL
jgi:hypothetical protein